MNSIPLGYKLTEVGVIPEDWEVKKMSELGEIIRGASPRPKGDRRFYGGSIPRLMVADVTRDGKFVTPKVDFLTEEGAKQSRPCPKGTLTIVCSGTVGIPSFLAVDACIHDGFLALIDIKQDVYDDYLYHQLTMLQSRFENSATHGGVFTNLTTDILSGFQIPLPSTYTEQRAIADALSEVDDQIAALDALIAKKRDLKQGAMQRLLTGEERLPGFSGAWEVKKLGELVEYTNGVAHERVIREHGEYIVVNSKFISTEGRVKKYSDYCFCAAMKNDILMVMSDVPNGRAIAKTFFVEKSNIYTVNQRICILSPVLVQPRLLSYLIDCNPYFLAFDDGVKQTNLRKSDVLNCPLLIPTTISEQAAITAVLLDMDGEISALEAEREKTLSLKQGMMQELLTGKTRLI